MGTAISVRVEAVPGGAALHCRLQQVRAHVTAGAFRVVSTSETEGGGEFELRLAGWGREGDWRQAGAGRLSCDPGSKRAEVRWPDTGNGRSFLRFWRVSEHGAWPAGYSSHPRGQPYRPPS